VIEPLRLSFVVACPPDHAFATWTAKASSWWPPEHTVSREKGAEIVFEPRTGGRIFERTNGGEEIEWGEITEWDPSRIRQQALRSSTVAGIALESWARRGATPIGADGTESCRPTSPPARSERNQPSGLRNRAGPRSASTPQAGSARRAQCDGRLASRTSSRGPSESPGFVASSTLSL
jgi:hypothetical protein